MTFLSQMGEYTLIKKIGEGAMSEVFLAHPNHDPNNTVAIKIPKIHLKNKSEYINRVRREAEILTLLNDQRIVKLLNVKEDEKGSVILIQEYVSGKNLEELLACDVKKIRPVVGAVIISEVLLGLEVAHLHEIIHRDLKPENIMITSEGRIKITDFGISKNLESGSNTTSGLVIGSPAYVSPEQIKGKAISSSSDFFTLGIMLYRYCTGEFPFKGNDYSSLLHNILNVEPTPISKLNSKVHPALTKIIDKALKKDPLKRYQKAYEFRYDLMKYLDHLGAKNPNRLLKLYYQQDPIIDDFGEDSLLSTIIRRAEYAFDHGDLQAGLILAQQALTLEPNNQVATKLLGKRRGSLFSKFKKVYLAIAILLLSIFSAIIIYNYYMLTSVPIVTSSAMTTTVTTVATPSPISTEAMLPPVLSANANKPSPTISKNVGKVTLSRGATGATGAIKALKDIDESESKEEIKKVETTLSWISFNVGEDVTIYIDGNLINKDLDRPVELTAGIHSLTLSKVGSPPIVSTVETFAGKNTIINAK